jgi:hypothetical protein
MTLQPHDTNQDLSQARFRYRQREDSRPGDRKYDVERQERPRGRWQQLGWVMGLSHEGGPASWAGLRDGADAWTEWHTTRQAAAQDMADGRTFKTADQERAAKEARAAFERMQAEARADEARWREEHLASSGPANALAAIPEMEA